MTFETITNRKAITFTGFILAAVIFVLAFPAQTDAYFAEKEAIGSAFKTGTLDFDLSKKGIHLNMTGNSSVETEFLYTGSLGFKYSVSAENQSGDLCPSVSVGVYKDGELVYMGGLKEDLTIDTDRNSVWSFDVFSPGFESSRGCDFDVVFRAWQENLPSWGSGGFSHEERFHIGLKSSIVSLKSEGSAISSSNDTTVEAASAEEEAVLNKEAGAQSGDSSTTSVSGSTPSSVREVGSEVGNTNTNEGITMEEGELGSSETTVSPVNTETVLVKISVDSTDEPRIPGEQANTLSAGQKLYFIGPDPNLTPLSLWKDGKHLMGIGVVVTGPDSSFWTVPNDLASGQYELHIDQTVGGNKVVIVKIMIPVVEGLSENQEILQ
ncbi:MAG: hypothetical protein Q8P52_03505 [bacterium]|nr:hypothetical protein [bacterium]